MTTTINASKVIKEIFSKKLEQALEVSDILLFDEIYYEKFFPSACQVALDQKHVEKNEYNSWGYPYDHNQITSISNYINASPMDLGKQRYIAAQGPRTKTFNEFWEMVWAEKVAVIVTVTNEIEHKGLFPRFKFNRFWPIEGEMTFGKIKIISQKYTLLHDFQKENSNEEKLHLREFKLIFGREEKIIYHLYLENWMDNGVIAPESLITLCKEIDLYKKEGAIAVHCAAGIGRTGTVIAFHSLYHDLLKALSQNSPENFDVIKRIKQMRKMRWGAIVATKAQYQLIIQALEIVLEKTSY